jgi:hypothetical protein
VTTDSSTGPRTPLPWTPATIIHLAFAGDVDFAVRAVNNHAKLLKALKGIRDCHIRSITDEAWENAGTAIEEAQS